LIIHRPKNHLSSIKLPLEILPNAGEEKERLTGLATGGRTTSPTKAMSKMTRRMIDFIVFMFHTLLC
jgi:hypothetical protein